MGYKVDLNVESVSNSLMEDILVECVATGQRAKEVNEKCEQKLVFDVEIKINGVECDFGQFAKTLEANFMIKMQELNDAINMAEEEALKRALKKHKIQMKDKFEETISNLYTSIQTMESATEDFINTAWYYEEKKDEDL